MELFEHGVYLLSLFLKDTGVQYQNFTFRPENRRQVHKNPNQAHWFYLQVITKKLDDINIYILT